MVGSVNGFLVKFNNAGVRQWATYYGSTGGGGLTGVRAYGCASDGVNVYLTGWASPSSGTVVATPGSHQPVNGGQWDAFLAKFDVSGVRLWATNYGGPDPEVGTGCTVDARGNVYMCGYTTSSVGIASGGAFQPAVNSTFSNAFLVKFNSAGVRQWGTYYGDPAGTSADACAVSPTGIVYLSGRTMGSPGNPMTTFGAHQVSFGGGTSSDAFVAAFNPAGMRLWGTYYGGTGQEIAYGCTADINNNVYISGLTTGAAGTIIATTAAHQATYGGGTYDAFLARFDSTGARQWGTYYGGSGYDQSFSCTSDLNGDVYICGDTDSNNGTSIATPGSHQSSFITPQSAFLIRFNAMGVRQWGTYYGFDGWGNGMSCNAGSNGALYLGGLAGVPASPGGTVVSTMGSHQSNFGGDVYDAFIVQFYECQSSGISIASSHSVLCAGQTATLTASGAGTFTWLPYNVSPSLQVTPLTSTSYTVGAATGGTCNSFAVYIQNVDPGPSVTLTSSSPTVCAGQQVTLTAAGGTNYSWTPFGSGSTFVWYPNVTGNYSVTGFNNNGCQNKGVVGVTVVPSPTISVTNNFTTVCPGQSVLLTASGALSYTWSPSLVTNFLLITPLGNFTTNVTGVGNNGCSTTTFVSVFVNPCAGVTENAGLSNFKVFPNPLSGTMYVMIQEENIIKIYNSLGQMVRSVKVEAGSNRLDVSELSNGVYILKTVNHPESLRVVKE
jgi:hypothetical protein